MKTLRIHCAVLKEPNRTVLVQAPVGFGWGAYGLVIS